MHSAWKSVAALSCALFLSGCLTPPDFDTGRTIHSILNVEPNEQPVRFVTTRCSDPKIVSDDQHGTRAELLSKRCWDVAPSAGEVPNFPFGLANGPSIHCGSAKIKVAGSREPQDSVIEGFQSEPCDTPFASIVAAVKASECHCALIFVHGYNTTLPYALRRTGQLGVDLGYSNNKGVPILFSFGAAGRLNDYVNDMEAAELAVPALHRLLVALKGVRVDIVAHSMGSRIALRAITEGDGDAPAVQQMVVAAPDVDLASFLQLAETALKGGASARLQRLTVYTAAYDAALAGSVYQHNGRDRAGEGLAPRAGTSVNGADVVDASNTATSGYGHSYFAESEQVIKDIKAALSGVPACKPDDPACARMLSWTSQTGLTIPCPNGESCEPSLYQRFARWIIKFRF